MSRSHIPSIALLVPLFTLALLALTLPRMLQHCSATDAQKEEKTMDAKQPKKVFDSPLAGMWYEADAERLAAEIDHYIASADTEPIDTVQALVLPHAGYRYSGAAAAFGLKAAGRRQYKRVIVMGPSHRVFMDGYAHVSDATHIATPLGEVPLDLDTISALLKHPEFRVVRNVDASEHSVQIQLPLLQRALKSFQLVPIVIGNVDDESVKRMATILQDIVTPDTLVIASSDFTHYGASFGYAPFVDHVLENLEKLDLGAWEHIRNKDEAGFRHYVDETGATICGRHPISILLSMLPGESEARLLKYDTSGRMTTDTSTSVSYMSIAFTGLWPEKKTTPESTGVSEGSLSSQEKALLLKLARGMLEAYIITGKNATPEDLGIEITPAMRRTMGVFVTLNMNGQLRGCIGEIFPRRPLYEAVMERAIDAGVNDPRFRTVTEKELPMLEYEISVLTPPMPVSSYRDIVLGKHGMVIQKNGHSAVFLPQVAPEQHWTLEETLTHLSLKAGLAADAWKEGASWTVFEAIVFNDQD